jgi:hypothetical protein
MNRKLRRAAIATARHKRPEETIRIHEAGHCVGRVLGAESLGWRMDEVIAYTEIYPTPMGTGESQDGMFLLESQATSYGMWLSKPMDDFLRARMRDRSAADATPIQYVLASVISEMRAAGIDVDEWFTAKSIEIILGPMAEAKFLGKPFADVFGDYSSEADLDDVRRLGDLCGKTQREAAAALAENVGIAYGLIERPEVWRAVQSAAGALLMAVTTAVKWQRSFWKRWGTLK